MNKEEATTFIINELSKHRDRNDIIMTLCHNMQIDWKKAELMVKEVESQHGKTVAKKQSPFLVFLGAAIIISGVGLTINGMQLIMDMVRYPSIEMVLANSTGLLRLGSLLTGLGMIVGGIVGFWKTFAAFLD